MSICCLLVGVLIAENQRHVTQWTPWWHCILTAMRHCTALQSLKVKHTSACSDRMQDQENPRAGRWWQLASRVCNTVGLLSQTVHVPRSFQPLADTSVLRWLDKTGFKWCVGYSTGFRWTCIIPTWRNVDVRGKMTKCNRLVNAIVFYACIVHHAF